MKRSQMISQIEHLLENYPAVTGYKVAAEILLDHIEWLGMLPPEVSVNDYHPESVFISEWEPE